MITGRHESSMVSIQLALGFSFDWKQVGSCWLIIPPLFLICFCIINIFLLSFSFIFLFIVWSLLWNRVIRHLDPIIGKCRKWNWLLSRMLAAMDGIFDWFVCCSLLTRCLIWDSLEMLGVCVWIQSLSSRTWFVEDGRGEISTRKNAQLTRLVIISGASRPRMEFSGIPSLPRKDPVLCKHQTLKQLVDWGWGVGKGREIFWSKCLNNGKTECWDRYQCWTFENGWNETIGAD